MTVFSVASLPSFICCIFNTLELAPIYLLRHQFLFHEVWHVACHVSTVAPNAQPKHSL